MADIEKTGLIVVRDGRVLLCQKRRTTSALILPGGKLEAGETPLECLVRELREELGDRAAARDFEFLGEYTHRAANNDPSVVKTIHIQLYRGELEGTPQASAEIGALVWFGEKDDWSQLAPSLSENILPDLVARGILPWSAHDAH